MADGPDYKDTKQIPKPDRFELLFADLKSEVKAGFIESATNQDANHKIVMHEIEKVKNRIDHIERWKSDSDQKFDKHSDRARELSDSDLAAKAELAQTKLALDEEIAARKSLAEETKQQTIMLRVLSKNTSKFLKILNSPTARTLAIIVTVIGGYIVTWLKK